MSMYEVYSNLSPSFYDESLSSLNPITRYYHNDRYQKIRNYLSDKFRKGMKILDLGSGSASWNIDKLAVTGLDYNEKMLGYGKQRRYLQETLVWDLEKKPFPLNAESFDFVVISEVLEHVNSPEALVKEMHRILKKQGYVIITVPLDTHLSLWSVLFGIECLVLGDMLGNDYYRKRCGHVQHFSVKTMAHLLEKNGFSVVQKNVTLMNIGMLAKKM